MRFSLTKQVSNHNIWYGRWSVYWAKAVSSIFELDEKWPANGFRNQAVGSQQGLVESYAVTLVDQQNVTLTHIFIATAISVGNIV